MRYPKSLRRQDERSSLGLGQEPRDPHFQALTRFRMALPPRDLPTPEAERELHRRLMEQDPTAPPDLVLAFLDHLIDYLRLKSDPRTHDHFCVQAAEDALLALIKNPDSYRLDQNLGLFSYLRMSAHGDLKNTLSTELRRSAKTKSLESVEHSPEAGKYLGRADDPSMQLEMDEEVKRAKDSVLALARKGLSEQETQAFDLCLQGERKTAVIALALGIDHLPQNEQVAEVKRFKDRMKNRIKRGRGEHAEPS